MKSRHVPSAPYRGSDAIAHYFGGRWYLETDLRWVHPLYGIPATNISQNGGANPDPIPPWSAIGIPIRAGESVSEVTLLGRGSSVEITGTDFRLYHQSGDWDGNWVDNTGVTLTLLGTLNNIFPSTAKKRYHLPVNYTASEDGILIPLVRPLGTITTRRFLYMTGVVEIQKMGGS